MKREFNRIVNLISLGLIDALYSEKPWVQLKQNEIELRKILDESGDLNEWKRKNTLPDQYTERSASFKINVDYPTIKL